MADYQYKAYDVDEKAAPVQVQGLLNYARVTSIIEGDELKRSIERDRSRFPQDKPHIILDLIDATVLPLSGDLNSLTVNEAYHQERRFADSKTGKFRFRLTPTVTRPDNLPLLFVRASNTPDEDGKYHYTQIVEPKAEFSKGTPIRVVLRAYKPANNENRGFAIHSIYVEDEHYEVNDRVNGLTRKDLADAGIIIDGDISATVPAETPVTQEDGDDSFTVAPAAAPASAPASPPAQPAAEPVQYNAPASAPTGPSVFGGQPQGQPQTGPVGNRIAYGG